MATVASKLKIHKQHNLEKNGLIRKFMAKYTYEWKATELKNKGIYLYSSKQCNRVSE